MKVNKKIKRKNILITGIGGFIGFHYAKKVLNHGYNVIGVDNLNDYYDVDLKKCRIGNLIRYEVKNNNMEFYCIDINNKNKLIEIFKKYHPDYVIHLAAEAGVRYSYEHPEKFIDTNLIGFCNILDCCKEFKPKNFVYASSSSVYGNTDGRPSKEKDNTDYPISIYGASKKCNEILAYAYHKFYNIKMTGLRFYTVIGSWGRPDMALGLFANELLHNGEIKVFNNGNMWRDFTHVDNIIQGIYLAMLKPQDYKIYNLGTGTIVLLKDMIEMLEKEFGKTVKKKYLPLQIGDVLVSFADIKLARKELGYKPTVFIKEGITEFVNWYKEYYGSKIQDTNIGGNGISRIKPIKRIKKTRL